MTEGKAEYKNLNQKQILALSLFLDPSIHSITELAEKADVSRVTIYNWMDDEEFAEILNKKIDQYTNSQTANVWKSLIMQALDGNVQAIKLFFEMKNKYRDRKEISGPGGEPIEFRNSARQKVESRIDSIAERIGKE